jgi:hypothetical protein
MADQLENKHVDKRVMQRYVKKAIIEEKELERYMKALPDLAEQAVPVEAAIEADELDDEDGEQG